MVNCLDVSCFDCGGKDVLQAIKFAMTMVSVVCTIIPILVILLIIIDFVKNVKAGNTDEMKQTFSLAVKKLIMCLAIFFVPTFVQIAMSVVKDLGVDYVSCVNIALKDDLDACKIVYKELDFDNFFDIDNHITSVVVRSSGDLRTDYPDEVIENLAAFMGAEAGTKPEGFEAQLITGAIFLNNMFFDCGRTPFVTSADQINKDTMCKTFSYASVYASHYCDYTLDTYGANEEQKKQLRIAAELVLSGRFSIPKDINGEGKMENWGGIAVKWGHLATSNGCRMDAVHEDGCSQVYSYSKYCVTGSLPDVDVFGKKVSTNFEDNKAKADKLYNSYVK